MDSFENKIKVIENSNYIVKIKLKFE